MKESNKIRKIIKSALKGFLNESKVATEDSPLGFYHISNALMPTEFFKKLDELNIKHSHDAYSNVIEVFVSDNNEGSIVRNLALSEIFEADDIQDDDLPYMTPEEIGDVMIIKLK